jgi:hypothetical protein
MVQESADSAFALQLSIPHHCHDHSQKGKRMGSAIGEETGVCAIGISCRSRARVQAVGRSCSTHVIKQEKRNHMLKILKNQDFEPYPFHLVFGNLSRNRELTDRTTVDIMLLSLHHIKC